ncbi:hypothetical protein LPJ61_005572 [Coemansia biformis]|uniref:DEUBAD domain-containing protein n=1 Tax=Coemansia biformis TaxID=1286918 RepID=A0A9W7Y9M5_9FUNG|nr:hypothetical protein LPJ61_005572 [Coemansia biformis]
MSAQVGGVPGANLRRPSQQHPGRDIEPMGESPTPGGINASQLSNLRQLLSSIRVPEGYRGAQASYRDEEAINLADVLTPENLRVVLEDSQLRTSLFPTLPDDIPHDHQSLDEVIRSPQFQQALNSLSYVLESGQMAPLVTQLGLEPEAGTSVHAFLRAIENQLERENSAQGREHGDDDDTPME